MNSDHPQYSAETADGRIEGIRSAFAADWQAGQTPRIEDYLEKGAHLDRTQLLRQLVAVDVEFRQKQGEKPVLEEYAERFPEESDMLSGMFVAPTTRRAVGSADDTDGFSLRTDSTAQSRDFEVDTSNTEPSGRFGDYELLEEIARGGMGVVYRARQISLDRDVALKMIRSGDFASPEEVLRFQTEARAAAALDHPNIVPIHEVGIGAGRHFFSMGFVDGQALNTRLKDGPLSPAEAATLVMVVAGAVQFAHEKGIVHRDLKPANILLQQNSSASDSGSGDSAQADSRHSRQESVSVAASDTAERYTPKITDFGLAKNIDADSGMTATGQIMGTPSYMPPEQASGAIEEIGPRSDVYSLGAILYCALTGRPPFQAANVVETLRHVLEQEPVAPRQLNPSVDSDLNTICLKCLEKDPERRYQTARDVANDLGRYLRHEPIVARPTGLLERAARWRRRNPMVALLLGLIAAVTIAGTAGVIWQWRLAEAARGVAQENFERADEKQRELAAALVEVNAQKRRGDDNLNHAQAAVYDFFTDVSFSPALLAGHPGTQALRVKLLNRALNYYLKFVKENKDAKLTPQLASAYRGLGFAQLRLGDAKQAAASLARSVQFWESLLESQPANRDYQFGLANALTTLGRAESDLGQPAEAMRHFRRAISLSSPLRKGKHDDTEARHTIAVCTASLGTELQRLGRTSEATTQFETSILHFNKLVESHPHNPEFQRSLANSHANLGLQYSRSGRLPDAIKHQSKAAEVSRNLVARFPHTPSYLEAVVIAANNVALAQERAGELHEAVRELSETKSLLSRLMRENPAVPRFRESLVAVASNLGRLFRLTGQLSAAMRVYSDTIPVAQRMIEDFPTNPEHKNRLAELLNSRGLVQERLDQPEKALAGYREGNALREGLLKSHPEQPQFAEELIIGYINVGNLLEDAGKLAQAEQEYQKGLVLAEQLVKRDPKFPKYLDRLAASHSSLAQIHSGRREFPEAVRRYQLSIEIGEKLARVDPSAADFQQSLARRLNNLGTVYRRMGKPVEAAAQLHRAAAIWTKLLSKHSGVAVYQRELINNYANLAEIALHSRQLKEASRYAEQAVSVGAELVGRNSGVSDYRNTLAGLYELQSRIARQQNRLDVALVTLNQGISIRRKLVKRFPKSLPMRNELAKTLYTHVAICLQVDQLATARQSCLRLISHCTTLIEANYDVQSNRVQLGGTRVNLAIVQAEQGHYDDALEKLKQAEMDLTTAVKSQPSDQTANIYLRNCRTLAGKVLNVRAWFAAVGPNANLESGQRAVRDATRACESAGWKNDVFVTTLAAALARSGKFEDAVKRIDLAIRIAPRRNTGLKQHLRGLFQKRQAFSLQRSVPPDRPARAKRPAG